MKLYLLRHGIAADLGVGGLVRDEDRPLTDEGRAKMKQEAQGMRKLELSFDLILTGPLLGRAPNCRSRSRGVGAGE